jgi:N-acetylglucosamine-6-phosphate deacetylase
MLGDLAVTVSDGVARLVEGGALAGSTLTMDKAFRLVVQHGGFSVADAVLASATTPARLMGRDDIGAIAVGKSADLVALDPDLRLHRVWHQGEIVTG